MKPEIAIIGYGRFGKLLAHYLKKDTQVFVSDKKKPKNVERGITAISLNEAVTKSVVVLAVPISVVPSILKFIAPLLQHGTLVCDVCSVKEQPITWMKDILPKHVSILGTHPLFGPDSIDKNLQGRTIVLCPVRIHSQQLSLIMGGLRKTGLNVLRMSPQRHDKMMASTLFLTHFIGRGLRRLNLPPPDHTTQNYSNLKQIVETAGNDTAQLFQDMYNYNRFAKLMLAKVMREFIKLSSTINSRSP